MEFKSRIDLAIFFKELEKEEWIKAEWLLKPHTFVKDGKEIEGTRAVKVYKINFNRVKKTDINKDGDV